MYDVLTPNPLTRACNRLFRSDLISQAENSSAPLSPDVDRDIVERLETVRHVRPLPEHFDGPGGSRYLRGRKNETPASDAGDRTDRHGLRRRLLASVSFDIRATPVATASKLL